MTVYCIIFLSLSEMCHHVNYALTKALIVLLYRTFNIACDCTTAQSTSIILFEFCQSISLCFQRQKERPPQVEVGFFVHNLHSLGNNVLVQKDPYEVSGNLFCSTANWMAIWLCEASKFWLLAKIFSAYT